MWLFFAYTTYIDLVACGPSPGFPSYLIQPCPDHPTRCTSLIKVDLRNLVLAQGAPSGLTSSWKSARQGPRGLPVKKVCTKTHQAVACRKLSASASRKKAAAMLAKQSRQVEQEHQAYNQGKFVIFCSSILSSFSICSNEDYW